MRKFLLIAMSLMVASQCVEARQLSIDEARKSAREYARTSSRLRSLSSSKLTLAHTEKSEDNNLLYVFNTNSSGYVIVSADDIAVPVLGYSDNGKFDINNIAPAMKYMLGEYGREISYAINHPSEFGAVPANTQQAVRTEIKPLITTKWSQNAPYSNLCPNYTSDTKCATGCVATAMAQVMNYFECPTKGTGSNSYTTTINGTSTTLSLDFSTITYDWANMSDEYNSSSTEAQNKAVATLMYSCGVAANMTYGESSGAYTADAALAFVKYFGYDKQLKHSVRDYYSNTQWFNLIYNELAAGRPIIYSGYTADGYYGHTFVCDGYSDDYFHFNWGWAGLSDGFYKLTALNPSQQGIGGSENGYNYQQDIIYNFKKNSSGAENTFMGISSGFTAKQTSATTSDNVSFTAGYLYYYTTYTEDHGILLSVCATNPVTNEKEYIYADGSFNYTVGNGSWGITDDVLTCKGSDFAYLPDGSYNLTPAYYDYALDKDLSVSVPYGRPAYCTLEKKGTTLTFTNATSSASKLNVTGFENISKFYTGNNYKFTADITCKNADYNGTVVPAIYTQSGEWLAYGNTELVSINKNGSAQIDFTGNLQNISAGTYTIYLLYVDYLDQYQFLDQSFSVTVAEAPAETAITAENPVVENSNAVVASSFDISCKFNCTKGFFCNSFRVCIYDENLNYIDRQDSEVLAINEGQSATVKAHLSMPHLEVGKTYYAIFYSNDSEWKQYTVNKAAPFIIAQTYSGVESVEAGSAYNVYPNPATDVITVSAPADIKAVEIYSASGQLVNKVLVDGLTSTTVNVEGLAQGIYMVKTVTAEGSQVSRIIKQ